MKKLVYILVILNIVTSVINMNNKNESWNTSKLDFQVPDEFLKYRSNWDEISMIIYEPSTKEAKIFNKTQAHKPLSPCSTYKIPHALIALETGIIEVESSTYKWDGNKYQFKSWNKDHNLKTAIQNSVVWYFQKMATKIGSEGTEKYINLINYGNKDISGGQKRYWLKSSLKISAFNQVKFLEKLYNNTLPFEEKNQEIVKDIIILDKKKNKILSGKTGGGKNIGWFIGYVETNNSPTFFALNLKNHPLANGSKAKEICLKVLKSKGIY